MFENYVLNNTSFSVTFHNKSDVFSLMQRLLFNLKACPSWFIGIEIYYRPTTPSEGFTQQLFGGRFDEQQVEKGVYMDYILHFVFELEEVIIIKYLDNDDKSHDEFGNYTTTVY